MNETNVDQLEYFDEFNSVINALSNTQSNSEPNTQTNSESNTDDNLNNIESGVETQTTIRRRRQRKTSDNINKELRHDNEVVNKNVLKVIQFDDKNLSLTYKEYLLFNEVTRIFIIMDNVF